MSYEGKFAVDSGLDDSTKSPADSHTHIDTDDDEKNVRINSRDYTKTSGDQCAVQIKPNMSVTGTGGITGLEVSPRFAEGIAGSKLVGIMSNPVLKKAAGGNLSSAMRCYEGKLESDSGSTRTVAEAYVLHAMQALHGTVTKGPYVLKVDAGGGNVAWAGLMLLPDDSQIAEDATTGTSGTKKGWIKLMVGSVARYIRLYDAGT